jgi:4-diphosphocytidyl-2-C-methyl-D-erythritol kinase
MAITGTGTMSPFSLPAPAKLNLFLHITGRRTDGYHELQTVFQLLDHGDTLHFSPLAEGELAFTCTDLGIEDGNNLVCRAARLLLPYRKAGPGWHIHLEKVLPHGGGLGGGSSDAATTLLALDRLWRCDLTLEQLLALGLQLGADVPVFINGYSTWAEGVGENLQNIALPPLWYLVLTPASHVATAEIFTHPQLTRDSPPLRIRGFPFSGCKNDCETVACMLYPDIGEALDWLKKQTETGAAGAVNLAETGITARMTGTGSSVFAGFPAREQAAGILAQLPDQYRDKIRAFVARGVNRSPLHGLLDTLPVMD